MADPLRFALSNLRRHNVPLVWAQFNGWLTESIIVSSGEPRTMLSRETHARLSMMADAGLGDLVSVDIQETAGEERMISAPAFILGELALGTATPKQDNAEEGWHRWRSRTISIGGRPAALHVSGILGADFLSDFDEVTFRSTNPDTVGPDLLILQDIAPV